MIQAMRKITKCEAESSPARLIDILQKNQARVKATLPFLFTSYFKYHNQTKNMQVMPLFFNPNFNTIILTKSLKYQTKQYQVNLYTQPSYP